MWCTCKLDTICLHVLWHFTSDAQIVSTWNKFHRMWGSHIGKDHLSWKSHISWSAWQYIWTLFDCGGHEHMEYGQDFLRVLVPMVGGADCFWWWPPTQSLSHTNALPNVTANFVSANLGTRSLSTKYEHKNTYNLKSCIGANVCRVLDLQAHWNKEKCLTKIICHSQLECFKISKQQGCITSISKETMILWSPFNSETRIVTVSSIKLLRRLVEKFRDGFKTSANLLQESNLLGQSSTEK